MKAGIMRWVPFGLFTVMMGGFWVGLSLNPKAVPAAVLEHRLLPTFELTALGQSGVLSSSDLKGRFSLLNVWASWCDICSEEQAFLVQLAKQGVAIYGVNYEDDPQNASAWLRQWGNPYRKVGQDVQGKVATQLGVYGTPETFLVDGEGRLIYRHVGPLTASVWRKDFLPRMKA